MFHDMPFLVFFSHLSSLLSSSLKRLGSSSFSRMSSHCLWYCCRGFSGKEVWSAFTPPSSAPPWQDEKMENTRESHQASIQEVHARDHWSQVLKTNPYTPITVLRVTWEPDSNSVVLFPNSQLHALLWEATLSRVEPWASLRCVEEKKD